MTISFELQDELQSLQEIDSYEIPHEHDPETEDPERLLEGIVSKIISSKKKLKYKISAAVEAVAESSDAIKDPEVFDVYRSLLKHSKHVPGTIMSKLLDSISSGLQAELDATTRDVEQGDQQGYMEHKLPLEMYGFLLQWFVTAAEKVKASDDDEGAAAASAPKARRGRGGKAGGRTNTRTTSNKKSESWTWDVQIPPTLALISKGLRLPTQRIWTTTAEREAFISCVFL